MKKHKAKNSAILIICRRFGFSYQRVNNWLRRGVPYRIQIEFPEVMKLLNSELAEKGE